MSLPTLPPVLCHAGDTDCCTAEQMQAYGQQALELCDACGWKAIMPGEPCFVCNMQTEAQQVAAPATVATLKRYEPELYDDRVRMELDSDGDWVKYADFLAHQVAVLSDIDQYRMQMAGISTAALGYWSEGDEIHPDYDTPALRDVARLYAKYDQLFKEKEARRAQQLAVHYDQQALELCPECGWKAISRYLGWIDVALPGRG